MNEAKRIVDFAKELAKEMGDKCFEEMGIEPSPYALDKREHFVRLAADILGGKAVFHAPNKADAERD